MPFETRIEGKDFDKEIENNKQFEEIIKKIKSDERFNPEFEYAIVKHKTRNINEYMVQTSNVSEERRFFLITNKKTRSIKIFDYIRIEKEQLKPLVSNVVENIKIK